MVGPIVITGGGTGGHIFPMQAVAEQLQASGVPRGELRFVGSRRGQEATLLAPSGVSLTLLPGRGIRRSLRPGALVANVGAVVGLFEAVVVALAKVRRWRPSVVVSVGGYASFAVAFAAVIWRRPLVLVDLDAAPGLAHRLLARFASRRCVAFPSNEKNAVVTGAPLREAIVGIDRSQDARRAARARMEPPIEPRREVVVVMTGSLGSARVNAATRDLAELWAGRTDRTLIHVTGKRDFADIGARRPVTTGLDYRLEEFADMAQLWAICDVAVCRAGATTVAELTALAVPSVLVPLPGAPGDHQTKNAVAVVEAGGALIIADSTCTGAALGEALDTILDPATLAMMSALAATLGRKDAAGSIARVVRAVGGLT
jgi:UDP-N-acetylglucosamine--N-acetylmuramyl-(pentapeptide) pyrophosphoryl-undecaprenol N-acetylglucosamine transferase